MGNVCECIRRPQDGDEAEDALLASLVGGEGGHGRPRGPPPPYQVCEIVCALHCTPYMILRGVRVIVNENHRKKSENACRAAPCRKHSCVCPASSLPT